jgi:hypothetical protein
MYHKREPLVAVRLHPRLLAAVDEEVGRRAWLGRRHVGDRTRSSVIIDALCAFLKVDPGSVGRWSR